MDKKKDEIVELFKDIISGIKTKDDLEDFEEELEALYYAKIINKDEIKIFTGLANLKLYNKRNISYEMISSIIKPFQNEDIEGSEILLEDSEHALSNFLDFFNQKTNKLSRIFNCFSNLEKEIINAYKCGFAPEDELGYRLPLFDINIKNEY